MSLYEDYINIIFILYINIKYLVIDNTLQHTPIQNQNCNL